MGKHYKSNNMEIVYANDIEQAACELFEKNFGIKPDNRDIRTVSSAELPGIRSAAEERKSYNRWL